MVMTSGPDDHYEMTALRDGARWVAGVDEVGRGCLAGPVVVAAVILAPARIPPGLADSKSLSAARREALFEILLREADAIAVAARSAQSIDRLNIRRATLEAMRSAVLGLCPPDASASTLADGHVLIDGRDSPAGLPCPAQAIIKGDGRCVSIAAASIIAKVLRDRMMRDVHRHFPAYGFDRHVGYGTAQHLAALTQFGASPYHRLSFAPLRDRTIRAQA